MSESSALSHRRRLAETVGDSGIVIVPAAVEVARNDDVTHPFRQDSDFVYLTGFHEPDAVAVITPAHPDGEYHLFVNPRDRETEIWEGYRAGMEGAVERFEADKAYPLSDLETVVRQLMIGRGVLWYRIGNAHHDDRVTRLLAAARSIAERTGRIVPETVRDVSMVLAEQRVVKTEPEIASLRRAAELSAEGHREAMRFAQPGFYEYEIQAAMEFVWRRSGSPRNGYPSIVGSGPNATILHYVENTRRVADGDLVLIDAAAEIDCYSADITRTFPVNGKFSPEQRAIYEVVLRAQQGGIEAAQPGATIHDVTTASRRVVAEGLVDLGLVPGSVDDALEMHLYREFFMHGVGHWLGLDVHDAGLYKIDGSSRQLVAGMTFTVEPGIYVATDRPTVSFAMLPHDLDEWLERRFLEGPGARAKERETLDAVDHVDHVVPEAFLGIGVRIEDDILMTAGGNANLSAGVPVLIDEIEALCAEKSGLAEMVFD